MAAKYSDGVDIQAEVKPGFEEILTPQAVDFVDTNPLLTLTLRQLPPNVRMRFSNLRTDGLLPLHPATNENP